MSHTNNGFLSMPSSSDLIKSMVFASCIDSDPKNLEKGCTRCDLCAAHISGCINDRILKSV
ncbi:MAG: hypothetical protein PHS92_03425 [Candidatus Gracilibacteria bacterium]|nr:hypothetical protein [Candidatus Gracilibacteria bacterium]